MSLNLDTLPEWYAELAAHGDRPLGEAPARLLLQRVAAAHAEIRANSQDIVDAASEALVNVAAECRAALAAMESGRADEARAILAAQVAAFDRSIITNSANPDVH